MRNQKNLPSTAKLSGDVAALIVNATAASGRQIKEEIRLRLIHSYTIMSEDNLRLWNAKRVRKSA